MVFSAMLRAKLMCFGSFHPSEGQTPNTFLAVLHAIVSLSLTWTPHLNIYPTVDHFIWFLSLLIFPDNRGIVHINILLQKQIISIEMTSNGQLVSQWISRVLISARFHFLQLRLVLSEVPGTEPAWPSITLTLEPHLSSVTAYSAPLTQEETVWPTCKATNHMPFFRGGVI